MVQGTISAPRSGPELLRLARRDREAACGMVNALADQQQADACLQLDPERRAEFLELVEHPERVVPLVPELALVATIRGSEESGWLLAYSTEEQRVACIDVDCWKLTGLQANRFCRWVDALIMAGAETLLRSLEELDLEVWILALRDMGDFGDECECDFSEDGFLYYTPSSDENHARIRTILRTVRRNPRLAWALMQGLKYEDRYESEEYARRWRTGRMADLGFPEREHAMRAYRPLRVEQAATIDILVPGRASSAAVALPRPLEGGLVAEALRGMDARLATDMLGYVLAVANTLAVADQMDLVQPGTIKAALDKAMRGIERGLQETCCVRGQSPSEVLAHSKPLDLFRIGATLDESIEPAVPDLNYIEQLLDEL